jgi:hypothetical protein
LTLNGTATLLNVNQILIASDTLPCAFCTDFYIQHYFGGSSARGAHEGIFSWVIQTTPNSGSGGGTGTIAIAATFIGQSNAGDGGTGVTTGTSLGTYFGINPIGRNAGTNIEEVTAVEDDLQTTAGSSAQYAFGHAITNFEAAQGAFDSGLVFYSGGSVSASGGAGPWGPGVGFHNGISFAELSGNGLPPVDSAATLFSGHLETLSTINAAYGIDLRNFTFSAFAFASNNFFVNQSGYLSASATEVAPVAISSLNTCNAGAVGSVRTVSNGVASPTYNGTVSTTGAAINHVFCAYNGTTYAWVYQ